jgi:hypothetical protein
VDEGTLGVHEIELVVHAGEDLGNGGGVGDHATGALHLGEIATGNNGGWLVVDATLEASWAPVDELDGALGLDGSDGSVDILGDDITTIKHAASHVLAMARIALDHLVGGLEAGVGDLSDGELLVVSLLSRDDGGVSHEGKVNTGVRNEVRLELSKIDVESTIEAERGGDGRNDLTNETIQVRVGGTLNVEVATADIVEGLVVDHEGTVGVLEGGVGGENRVVRLDNSRGHLGSGVDGELELGLLAVVYGETLHEEGGETRTRTTTEGVEEEKALETGTLVSELAGPVENEVDNLLTNGVVTTGVVVGGVFLTGNELLGVEELAVGTGADLIDHSGLEIDKDTTGNVLAGARLGKEGVERVITATDCLVAGHLTIRLDTVLEAVKLPAGITGLDTSLSDVDRDTFAHD